ncbi:MAG: oligosaccharide flippase family protein [Alphaproteobacteria bacterium]|nr:oligosaccharide flippase family protein [Alphaproteobacteria bacterium]
MSDQASPNSDGQAVVGTAVRSAMVWNLVSMAVSQLAQGGIFILLTQRLDPETFGLFAMAAAVTDLFYVLATTAAIDAVVQRQEFDRRTLSTAFWTMAAVTAPVCLVVAAAGSVFAGAVNEPRVAPIFAALSLSLVPLPFSIAPYARMRQNLDFKGIALRGMLASFLGGIVALTIAFTAWAEWALVVQRCLTLALAATLMSLHVRVVPTWEFDGARARTLLSAAGRIFLSHGVGASGPRLTDLVFGISFGPAVLGCLRVAFRLSEMAVSVLVNPINQMWVVVISKAGSSSEARKAVFIQLSQLVALLCLPGYVGLALVAGEITHLALRPEYSLVASFLAILCGIGVLTPVVNSRNAILTALNRTGLLLTFSVIDLVVLALAMLAAVRLGPEAALWATGAPAVMSALIAAPIVLRHMNVRLMDVIKAVGPAYVAVGVMAVGLMTVQPVFDGLAIWMSFLLKAILGAALYAGTLLVAFRSWTFDAVRSVAVR